MPSPSLSASTPFQRAMSSSTPRPTSLSLACSMPSLRQPVGVDRAGVMPVVHLVVIEDVPQRIPVRRRLDRHVERIVGIQQAALPARPARRCRWPAWCGSGSSACRTGRAADRSAPSGMPSANTLPRLISLPAATMSSGVMWLSVPIWSSLPQRPQLESALKASIDRLLGNLDVPAARHAVSALRSPLPCARFPRCAHFAHVTRRLPGAAN